MLNNRFFDSDCPESFYWAGFIAADGGVVNNSLSIRLSINDLLHLNKFGKQIGYAGKITTYDQRPTRNSVTAVIRIYSKHMVDSLCRFNIGPRKSLTYYFPEWAVNHKYLNHFLRGYNDGDGGFVVGKDNVMFKVSGTKQFLEIFKEYLSQRCGVNRNANIGQNGKIHTLQYSGRLNLIKIRNFLYDGSAAHMELDRKRNLIFCDMIGSDCFNRNKMPIISTDIFGKDLVFYSTQMAAEKDGFISSKISCCVAGKRKTHKNRMFRKATETEIKLYGDL